MNGARIFSTKRDHEANSNNKGRFAFPDKKDGVNEKVIGIIKRDIQQYRRQHVRISGQGCASEVAEIAYNEDLVADARRNGRQVSTRITVMYSKELEVDNWMCAKNDRHAVQISSIVSYISCFVGADQLQ